MSRFFPYHPISSIFVLVSFQGFSITYAEHWFGRWSWHWAVALRHTGRQQLNVLKASPQPLSWSFYALWWLHQKIVRPNAIDEVGSNIFHIETILSQPNLWCRGSRSHGCNALDVPPRLRLSLELPTLVCKPWPKIKAYHHIKLLTSSLSLSLSWLKSTCLQEEVWNRTTHNKTSNCKTHGIAQNGLLSPDTVAAHDAYVKWANCCIGVKWSQFQLSATAKAE